MVVGMPDEYVDPSGDTQAFRAFVESTEPAAARPSAAKLPLIIGAAVGAVVILALIGWLALG